MYAPTIRHLSYKIYNNYPLLLNFATTRQVSAELVLLGRFNNKYKEIKLIHIKYPHAIVPIPPEIISHNFTCIHQNIMQTYTCESIVLVNEYVFLGVITNLNVNTKINKTWTRLRAKVGWLFKMKCLINIVNIIFF